MDDTFHWYWYEGPIEDVARYKLGGYHPVKLGDCFSTLPASVAHSDRDSTNLSSSTLPRYRILHKLGHGSFATVWLARDMLPPGCFVALKIIVADLPDSSREARILKILADESSVNILGSQHVLSLKDNFRIAGPNGTHEVLVTEVLASLSDLGRYPIYNKFITRFIREAFLGVSYMHSRGIAHGDLHLDNFGCTLPGLNEHSEWEVIGHFGNPDCVPVLAVSPMNQTASIPPYLVSAISMADYLAKSKPLLPIESYPPSLKILDFGNSYQQGEVRPPTHCAIKVRPPEVVFRMIALGHKDPDWDVRSDVWSLACTIYEIVVRCTMFYGVGARGSLHRMAHIVGQLPPLWESYWVENERPEHRDVSAAGASAKWMRQRPIFVSNCETGEQADHLIDLLRTMLVLDPDERPSIRQVMETHSWFETSSDG